MNINVPIDQWVNINTLSGIPAGTHIDIYNSGSCYLRLQEGTSQPSPDSIDGLILTHAKDDSYTAEILPNSLPIWAITSNNLVQGKITIKTK